MYIRISTHTYNECMAKNIKYCFCTYANICASYAIIFVKFIAYFVLNTIWNNYSITKIFYCYKYFKSTWFTFWNVLKKGYLMFFKYRFTRFVDCMQLNVLQHLATRSHHLLQCLVAQTQIGGQLHANSNVNVACRCKD